MNSLVNWNELEVGYDIPARVGMRESEVQTPCLVVDLDALERNIKKMGDFAKANGMRHRVHGKMHKSVDVALLQEKLGGSCGVCCLLFGRLSRRLTLDTPKCHNDCTIGRECYRWAVCLTQPRFSILWSRPSIKENFLLPGTIHTFAPCHGNDQVTTVIALSFQTFF